MNFLINKCISNYISNYIAKPINRLISKTLLISIFLFFSFATSANLSTELIEIEHKPIAPRFNLPDMQDESRELTDYLGKPVIISFWATWCPPCRKEIPYFNRAWEKLKNDEIEMLFVNINEGKETIEAYTKDHPIKLKILRDEGAGQLKNWNMTGLPTTFVIDPEGRVVYQAMGERAWDSDDILDKVRALRAKTNKTSKKIDSQSNQDKTNDTKIKIDENKTKS